MEINRTCNALLRETKEGRYPEIYQRRVKNSENSRQWSNTEEKIKCQVPECDSETETVAITTLDSRSIKRKQPHQKTTYPASEPPIPVSLTKPLLSHDLIGLKESFGILIGQNAACKLSHDDLKGQQQPPSTVIGQSLSPHLEQDDLIGEHELSDSGAIPPLSSKILLPVLNENLENSSNQNQHLHIYSQNCSIKDFLDSGGNCPHLESDSTVKYIGDENDIKCNPQCEKSPTFAVGTVNGDTNINKPCSYCNLSLTNKPVSDLNSKCKCSLFSHARHLPVVGKFSTPGEKLNHENVNTPSGLQHRSTIDPSEGWSNVVAKSQGTIGSSIQYQHTCGETVDLRKDLSDLESYYTAATDFGSDFYAFSASSFVTCQEYLTSDQRSRLTKAKDILIKGRNYVKAKFENYQKKFPRRVNNSNKSGDRKCGGTCGFPCLFLGREVSQFSFGIPECSQEEGDNKVDSEGKGCNSKCNNDLSGEKEKTGDNIDMSEKLDVKENHLAKPDGSKEVCVENGQDIRESRSSRMEEREARGSLTDQMDRTEQHLTVKEETVGKPRVEEESESVSKATVEDMQDDLPVGTEAHTINMGDPSAYNIGTEIAEQTLQTETRLLLLEESDQDFIMISSRQLNVTNPIRCNSWCQVSQREKNSISISMASVPIPKLVLSENDSEQKPTNKRLRWVSAMDKTQTNSLASSTTSNSSVEQFLYEREMDPEKLLKDLGFGFSVDSDISYGRIPDRFLQTPSSAGGIDLYKFVLHHPDLHHLLWMWDKKSEAQSVSGTSNQSTGKKTDAWGRQPTLSSLVHGMKFIQGVQAEAEANRPKQTDNTDNNVKDISKIHSVLDLPNRAFLASQGFYGKEYVDKEKAAQVKDKEEDKTTPKSASAAERRKQFLQSSKSKNWSLTDEPDDEDYSVSESSSTSFDRGLTLRSFSEGLSISSESSLEGGDSFNEEDRRRKSIGDLRRQYHETIRQSIDGEFPVFPSSNSSEKEEIQSTKDRRKKEVDRLMASLEDDGDYFAQSRQSSIKEVGLIKKQSQPSKESTLTNSPMTPKNFDFSFEKDDKEKQFQFSTPTSPTRKTQKQEISIIVEDETDCKEAHNQEVAMETEMVKDVKADILGLSPIHLMKIRSDSSHTLVSQDSNFDMEFLGGDLNLHPGSNYDTDSQGDLTPRPGDISPGIPERSPIFVNEKQIYGEELSESTSSSGTMSTMIICDIDQDQRSRSTSQVSMTTVIEPELNTDQLKPAQVPPQESFELEEISSADNGIDDMIYTYNRPPRRGMIEKSASTHSDSSGFADFESPGETSQNYLDLQQENFIFDGGKLGVADHDKKTRSPPFHHHDNRSTHNPLQSHPVSRWKQIGLRKSKEKLSRNTVIYPDNDKSVHVCSKNQRVPQNNIDLPSLTSISYTKHDNQSKDKSLVYTISVPYKGSSSRSSDDLRSEPQGQNVSSKRKFVSSVNLDITVKTGKSGKEKKNIFTARGPVDYKEIDPDLEHRLYDPKVNTSHAVDTQRHRNIDVLSDRTNIQKHSAKLTFTEIFPGMGKFQSEDQAQLPGNYNDNLLPGNRGRSNYLRNELALKQRIDREKKSKESLVSAKRQMVNWLLSNQKQNSGVKSKFGSIKPHGHHLSVSTPSLKVKQCSTRQLLHNQRSFERRSLDAEEILNDDHSKKEYTFGARRYNRNSLDSQDILSGDTSRSQSRGSPVSSQELFQYKSGVHQQKVVGDDMKYEDSALSGDESIGVQKRSSLVESSLGMQEEHLEYLKLARLVNGPSNLMSSVGQRTPRVHYRPTVPLKHWSELHKTKHLEEETRLLQHAVQRYKIEMTVMETVLFNMCQLASSELTDEERADVEELQCLWSEVRKEIGKLDEQLSYRLSSVLAGNDNFSPLNAMEVVQSMIDLLREQLYQQQLCISRDLSCDEDDLDLSVQSPRSSLHSVSMTTAVSEPALADFTHQMTDIRENLLRTQLQQQANLNKSFSDLKEALVDEVRSEVNNNTKWLQDQLQSKDSEIQRLRTEMFIQNLKTGTTRKRQYFESDV